MKTLFIAAAAAIILASGAANAANVDAIVSPGGSQAEVTTTFTAPAGFFRGVGAYEAQASIAHYAAAQQGPAGTVVGSANTPNDYHTSNG